jgi:hypothetical protein
MLGQFLVAFVHSTQVNRQIITSPELGIASRDGDSVFQLLRHEFPEDVQHHIDAAMGVDKVQLLDSRGIRLHRLHGSPYDCRCHLQRMAKLHVLHVKNGSRSVHGNRLVVVDEPVEHHQARLHHVVLVVDLWAVSGHPQYHNLTITFVFFEYGQKDTQGQQIIHCRQEWIAIGEPFGYSHAVEVETDMGKQKTNGSLSENNSVKRTRVDCWAIKGVFRSSTVLIALKLWHYNFDAQQCTQLTFRLSVSHALTS